MDDDRVFVLDEVAAPIPAHCATFLFRIAVHGTTLPTSASARASYPVRTSMTKKGKRGHYRWSFPTATRPSVASIALGTEVERTSHRDVSPPTCQRRSDSRLAGRSNSRPVAARDDRLKRGPIGPSSYDWQLEDQAVVISPVWDRQSRWPGFAPLRRWSDAGGERTASTGNCRRSWFRRWAACRRSVAGAHVGIVLSGDPRRFSAAGRRRGIGAPHIRCASRWPLATADCRGRSFARGRPRPCS